MSNTPIPALAILGPTASGKSDLGLWMAAQGFPIEIISLDSALVFKDMNIGTAKPTPDELAQVPHHLIDIITPEDVFNAADFLSHCNQLIQDIRARGSVPVILGGTMMYYKALLNGIDDLPPANADIRQEIEQQGNNCGWPSVHNLLAEVDPISAARLAPNDSQRLQRALEVYRITGKPLSSFHSRADVESRELPTLSIEPSDRSAIHKRVEKRFIQMIDKGLIEEVIALKTKYRLFDDMPSMRCVGYRQVLEYLDGRVKRDKMIELGIIATRQLAKRQMTWLRSTPNRVIVDPLQSNWMEQAKPWLQKQIEVLNP